MPLAVMILQFSKITIIEDRDLLATKIGDCAPVKAREEVWRIRARTWDPHLNFSKSHLGWKQENGHHVMSRVQLASLTVPAEVVVLAADTFVSEDS